MKQKITNKSLVATTPIAEMPKGKGRQKVVLQEETSIRRSLKMRGKVYKDSTVSKMSTKESLVQIISDHFPPHPEITNIPKSLNKECRDEIKENPIDTPASLSDISGSKDKTIPKQDYPNTTLIPHKSTWITGFVEHLWKEQRKRKRDHEEESSSITL